MKVIILVISLGTAIEKMSIGKTENISSFFRRKKRKWKTFKFDSKD